MKIVQINACYRRGSTGRMAMEMHDVFLKEGHDSYVFAPGIHEESDNIVNIGCTLDYKVHSILSRIIGIQGGFSYFSTKSVLRQISLIKPDIVHLHNLHNNYINYPLLLKYLAKNNIATCITMHDFWFMTGHCCYYTNYNCMKWQSHCGKCPTLHLYNKSYFFDNTKFNRNNKERLLSGIPRLGIIGNSRWTMDECRKSFLNKFAKFDFVYNWVNEDCFTVKNKQLCRQKHGESSDSFILLGVAQGWNDLKGLSVFEEIAKRLSNCQIILIGEMYDKRHLPSNIKCIGTIRTPEILADYYNLCDVYINPSVQETFGLVTAEALSSGLRVIANDATATPELVLPGCGHTVHDNNVDEYIHYINEMKAETYDPNFISQEARKAFGKMNILKYIDFYKELLGE